MSDDPGWDYFNDPKLGRQRRDMGTEAGMGNAYAQEALAADYAFSAEAQRGKKPEPIDPMKFPNHRYVRTDLPDGTIVEQLIPIRAMSEDG